MTVMQDSSALVLEEGTNPGLPFLMYGLGVSLTFLSLDPSHLQN